MKRMRTSLVYATLAAAIIGSGVGNGSAQAAGLAGGSELLNSASFWRWQVTHRKPVVSEE